MGDGAGGRGGRRVRDGVVGGGGAHASIGDGRSRPGRYGSWRMARLEDGTEKSVVRTVAPVLGVAAAVVVGRYLLAILVCAAGCD